MPFRSSIVLHNLFRIFLIFYFDRTSIGRFDDSAVKLDGIHRIGQDTIWQFDRLAKAGVVFTNFVHGIASSFPLEIWK